MSCSSRLSHCDVCPRSCKVDRTSAVGICGEGEEMRIAKIMLHKYEEPCISGSDPSRGSGAVFFSGCPLRCVYCQNKDISRGGAGRLYSPKALADELCRLEAMGAYNINLVTPTHFIPQIIKTLDIYKPSVPTVFNTSGYETVESVRSLSGYADIFLADMKYASGELAARYSKASDYPRVALRAIREMVAVAGKPRFDDDGMMKGGVILRHLVLPGQRRDSAAVLRAVANEIGTENVVLSLMSQYTPEFAPAEYPELCRRVTSFEYGFVLDTAVELGFSGFCQDRQSAKTLYTPDFL